MFVIKIYHDAEGDLPGFADAHLDVGLQAAMSAACARLDGAHARIKCGRRPQRARIYLRTEDGPDLLVNELHATEHGAVEIERPPN